MGRRKRSKKGAWRSQKKKGLLTSLTIEAKPTTYRGTTYRSRLEARWAVYLDHHPLVDQWSYEPKTFTDPKTNWNYTPDFVVKAGMVLQGWLEIKPLIPIDESLAEIYSFVEFLPGCQGFHLGLTFGDFYEGEPRVFMMGPSTGPPTRKEVEKFSVKLSSVPILGNAQAVKAAGGYRFDLPESVPRSRKPSGSSPWDHWTED